MHVKTDNPNERKKKQQEERIELFLKPLLCKSCTLLADTDWTFLIQPHFSVIYKLLIIPLPLIAVLFGLLKYDFFTYGSYLPYYKKTYFLKSETSTF